MLAHGTQTMEVRWLGSLMIGSVMSLGLLKVSGPYHHQGSELS